MCSVSYFGENERGWTLTVSVFEIVVWLVMGALETEALAMLT